VEILIGQKLIDTPILSHCGPKFKILSEKKSRNGQFFIKTQKTRTMARFLKKTGFSNKPSRNTQKTLNFPQTPRSQNSPQKATDQQ
jgi:flagellar biosynthesis GTPase FlhF